LASGGWVSTSRPPRCDTLTYRYSFIQPFLALNILSTLKYNKSNKQQVTCFAFSALFRLFFTSNYAVFVGGAEKILFHRGAGCPSYGEIAGTSGFSNNRAFAISFFSEF